MYPHLSISKTLERNRNSKPLIHCFYKCISTHSHFNLISKSIPKIFHRNTYSNLCLQIYVRYLINQTLHIDQLKYRDTKYTPINLHVMPLFVWQTVIDISMYWIPNPWKLTNLTSQPVRINLAYVTVLTMTCLFKYFKCHFRKWSLDTCKHLQKGNLSSQGAGKANIPPRYWIFLLLMMTSYPSVNISKWYSAATSKHDLLF